MSDVNIPLLRKAVEWVEEQAARPLAESEWDQNMWVRRRANPADAIEMDEAGHTVCGTTYCVAGKLCLDEFGPEFNGRNVGWSEPAGRLLGISPTDQRRLFRASNTAEDVRRIAEQIAGERL